MAKKIALFFSLFLFPLSVLASPASSSDCYTVSGAGLSSYNGQYVYNGIINSYPAYTNGSILLYVRSATPYSYWVLNDSTADNQKYYQYNGTSFIENPTSSLYPWDYNSSNGGTSPAPTITFSDCATTSTSTVATATSTVPYGDWLFLNVLILFCLAFIPIGTLFSLISTRK